MKFIPIFIFLLSLNAQAQTTDFKKAPNSYIYDLDLANNDHYDGINIPVRKAYEMWESSTFLKIQNKNNPIPAGTLSATLFWEDVPGLVSSVEIEQAANPADSKIAVHINNGKGKGNAVVAFKVNGEIFWSWHVWVTDNPENGVVYQHGFESNFDDVPATIQYMDRNLGAVSNHFIGNNWQKSSGMMYEWGRKDPFPPLVNKDQHFYELNGEVGNLKHPSIAPNNTIPVVVRPSNDIGENMRYSAKNPIHYIVNIDNSGNWFSNQRHKTPGTDFISWDLWSDNAEGGNSNANSSSTVLSKESRTYELKSELDPCPNGFRVPSYYGRVTQNNNLSFFGRKSNWSNDDPTVLAKILPNAVNTSLDGIKVYPGLGMDFTNAYYGQRNIGVLPVSGGMVYYPNSVAPGAPIGSMFQDNNANGVLWSATYGYDGARGFSMISDPARTNTTVGLNAIYNNQTFPTKSGNAVRCMKDVNLLKIGDFPTEYITSNKTNDAEGLYNPNTYLVLDNNPISIPVNKAFAVYNQLLTNHDDLQADKIVAKVLWTTNPKLIKNIKVEIQNEVKNSIITVFTNEEQYGSAVISLHEHDTSNPALWSWMIWAPKKNPEENTLVYTTEQALPTNGNFVNPTKSMLPPLTTEFMTLNLGAETPFFSLSEETDAKSYTGHHYQWGRKDALPNFPIDENGNEGVIYLGSENSSANQIFNYQSIVEDDYRKIFTTSFNDYQSLNGPKHKKISDNISYSVQFPLNFLYQESIGDIYNGGTHVNNLNKIKDWVLDERNQAADRWGHADRKSPYDPCPDGWRVPDVSFTNLYTGSKGNSPWYNGFHNDVYGKPGVIQDQWHNVQNFYNGVYSPNGFVFENSYYNIGNFGKDGIRGELGENNLTFERYGVWTASLADRDTGFALALQFEDKKMQTGTGVYPQAGMGVRCAKDEVRYMGNASAKGKIHITDKTTNAVNLEKEFFAYTNEESFVITNPKAKNYSVYDMSGKLVLSGGLKNMEINTASLLPGYYLLTVLLENNEIISQKILRK